MTGLEKIIEHINNDAAQTANEIIDGAKAEAERIKTTAKEEAQKQCASLESHSKTQVIDTHKRGESAADLKEKRMILEAKQHIIDSMIHGALLHLQDLSDTEYFEIVTKMVAKYAQPRAGKILFSEKDNKRMPAGYQEKINDALKGRQGAELELSSETRKLDGGFVLVYGEIEENCSFEALFSASKEALQDKVGALLFG